MVSRFGSLVCALAALSLSGRSAPAGEDSAAPRVIVDFGQGEKPTLPARHGIAFAGDDLPAARPLAVGVASRPAPGRQKADRALRIKLGSASLCEYWFEFDQHLDWRDFADGRLVVRLFAPDGVSATLCLTTERQRISAPMMMESRIVRTAMARDGHADLAIPLERFKDQDADSRADDQDRPVDLSTVKRIAIRFTREPRHKDSAGAKIFIYSLKVEPTTGATAVLEDLERRAFAYFEDHHHLRTGLVRDRASNFDGHGTTDSRMASIAATGYYLSYLPVAVERKWLTKEEAIRRARQTLEFAEKLDNHHGLFYHFVDWENGSRWGSSEVSCLDSAIFLNSALVCAVAFPELAPVVDRLLERIDWTKFLTEKDGKVLLSLGWTPENGLLGAVDVRTSEAAMPLLLAVGSGQVDPAVWYNTSVAYREIAGYSVLHGGLPLFVSYYGLGWANPKGMVDRDGVDLYQNAINAAKANREYCRTFAALQAATYHVDQGGYWGISAGDAIDESGRPTYVAPGPIFGDADGTVWPMTALAAYPWAPDELDRDLARWRGGWIWPLVDGKYGIAPFNLENGFIGNDLIGIDLGAFLLNLANHRSGAVWKRWQAHPLAKSAYQKIGFRPAPPSEQQ